VIQVQLAIQVRQEPWVQQDSKVFKDRQDNKESKETLVIQVQQENKVQQVFKDRQENKAFKVQQEIKDQQESKDQRVFRDQQAIRAFRV